MRVVLSMLTLVLAVAGAEPIHVEERRPLSVVLLAPLGALSVIDASRVIDGLSRALKANTDLEVVSLEAERAADCAGELFCLIERTGARPPLFLVLSAVRSKVGDRISATLVDVERARETRSSEDAVLMRPEWTEIADGAALDRFTSELISRRLKSRLEQFGAWEPFGQLEIEGLPEGTAIALDGITRGVASEGGARFLGLRPGARAVSFEHPAREPAAMTVEIVRGEVTRVSPALEKKGAGGESFRSTLFWAGAGTAVLGAGVTVYAIAAAKPDRVLCVTLDPMSSLCSAGAAFHQSEGIALAPIGYSVLATGAIWALGSLFLGDRQDVPWVALIAGIGAGVFSYALSTALDGPTP